MASEVKIISKTFKTNEAGQISLTGILNVEAFRKVNLEFVHIPPPLVEMTALCQMGLLSGQVLVQTVEEFPLAATDVIHSLDVIGPEFTVLLTGGPPNTEVFIHGWVFLH